MITLLAEWETFLRQHRLPLVTSIREEIVDLITTFVPLSIEEQNKTIFFFVTNGKEGELCVKFTPIFGDFQVTIWRDDKVLVRTSTITKSIHYKDGYVSREETLLLREFFRSWYSWCQKMKEKGDRTDELRN